MVITPKGLSFHFPCQVIILFPMKYLAKQEVNSLNKSLALLDGIKLCQPDPFSTSGASIAAESTTLFYITTESE